MNTSNNKGQIIALLTTISLLMLIISACNRQARSKSQASNQSASSDPAIEVSPADEAATAADPCSQMFSNFFVNADSIAYGNYEVSRLEKVVHDKPSGMDVSITYAVMKLEGKIVATFDGVYSGSGNERDFGFASLLGGDAKQLLVSQTVRRGGRHWVVDLSSNATNVFDSKDWDLSDEDVCVHDYDGDGVAEISMAITDFWGFEAMSMSESPLPAVVFRYEPSLKRYMPDKSAFARELINIDDDVQKIDPNEIPRNGLKGPYLATRLDILLRYVYAGRESDAWSFFDKTYNLDDKKDIEQKIRAVLAREPVYTFVYRGSIKPRLAPR